MKAEQSKEQDVSDVENINTVDSISMSSFATTSRHQFFEGAERGQILDVLPLLHLEDKNCVLVEAEQGYGKTSLAQQMQLQTLEYEQDVSMVHGDDLAHEDDVLLIESLASYLKLTTETVAEVEVKDGTDLARLYGSQQKRRLVLVIDDAQQLSSLAVSICVEFLSALPKNQVQLVFLSPPKAQVLMADSALQDYLIQYGYHVCLKAFNSRETSEYIRFLLIITEREQVVLSRQALSRIFQVSAGVPSRINEALVYALQEWDQQPEENQQGRSQAVPKWHLVSLSLVAAGVLALILFGNPDQTTEPRFSETIRGMPDKPETPTYNAPPILFTDAKAPQPLHPSRPLDGQLDSGQSIENKPVNSAQLSDYNQVSEDGASSAALIPATTTLNRNNESILEQEPLVEPKKLEPVPQPKVSLNSKIAKLKAERESPSAVSSVSAAKPQSIQADAVEAATWVKGMQPDHFTLQLLGGANESAIRRFVKDNGSLRKMGYFETKHDGRAWYVVVYGDFPSKAQALAAANSLPNQLRTSKPWPRSAADIQAKMR